MAFPNIIALLGLFLTSAALGVGFGMILAAIAKQFPVIDAVTEIFLW